jgi:hypothetical protein
MAEILSQTALAGDPQSAAGAGAKPRIETFGLILGGMKCGSTSLYDYLVTHPQVARCRIKEPNFFSVPKGRGPDRYPALWRGFDPARHRVALEASVSYTKLPRYGETAAAIEAYRQNTGARFRMLYIMRNPIDRAESHIAHNISKGRCSHDDYSSVMRLAIDTSRYAMQLARYHKLAGKDGLLLLNFDELRSDPQALLQRSARFLGLDDFTFEIRPPSNVRSAVNDSTSFRLPQVERAWLRAALAEDMGTLGRKHGFDVSGWGFKASPRAKKSAARVKQASRRKQASQAL